MGDLQDLFNHEPRVFAMIDSALTLRVTRSSEEYVACPNKECRGVSFYRPEMLCCQDDFECSDCGFHWRMPGQEKSVGAAGALYVFLSSHLGPLFSKVYNSNTYSDLYKVFFA
jgi:hypothetical protein